MKLSKKDVSVLMTISEVRGTMSLIRWMKDSAGGKSRLILNTVGEISSLCPVPEFSRLDRLRSLGEVLWRDLDTRPGTDERRISSNSSCSAFISDDFLSTSSSLNSFYNAVRKPGDRDVVCTSAHTLDLSLCTEESEDNPLVSVVDLNTDSPSVAR